MRKYTIKIAMTRIATRSKKIITQEAVERGDFWTGTTICTGEGWIGWVTWAG
jgi:hypothetical protein